MTNELQDVTPRTPDNACEYPQVKGSFTSSESWATRTCLVAQGYTFL
ncbi:MAG: hypothetical protein NUV81_03850 [bacterium]|nr:hypothetical protein [bacterium]